MRDGVLFVNKKTGITSKDVSRLLEKKFPSKTKMGHIGTLDPLASGVLPIAIGKATRLQGYLVEGTKTYTFRLRLGSQTDSLDLDGETELNMPCEHVTEEMIQQAVANFPTQYEQTPPLYSSVKYKGRPLHKWARMGQHKDICLEDLKRTVTIHQLSLEEINLPEIQLVATVSKGTYIRALARDFAKNLNTCATVTRLIRRKALDIHDSECINYSDLEAWPVDKIGANIQPIAKIQHPNLTHLRLNSAEDVAKLRHGQPLILSFAELAHSLKESSIDQNTLVKKTFLLFSDDQEIFGIAKITPAENVERGDGDMAKAKAKADKSINPDSVVLRMVRGL